MKFLFPTDQDFITWHEPNDTSCVLKIATPHHSALLVGDIGIAQEKTLMARYPASDLQSDILLVPHHGSKTSSSEEFITTVAPSIALFQVGYKNRYGHPKPEIWQRYSNHPIKRIRTDQSGAVFLKMQADRPIETLQAKQLRKRYWHVDAIADATSDIED